jgi:hypothetical protein
VKFRTCPPTWLPHSRSKNNTTKILKEAHGKQRRRLEAREKREETEARKAMKEPMEA